MLSCISCTNLVLTIHYERHQWSFWVEAIEEKNYYNNIGVRILFIFSAVGFLVELLYNIAICGYFHRKCGQLFLRMLHCLTFPVHEYSKLSTSLSSAISLDFSAFPSQISYLTCHLFSHIKRWTICVYLLSIILLSWRFHLLVFCLYLSKVLLSLWHRVPQWISGWPWTHYPTVPAS